ncbi:ATP-binding protein [Kitasatospora sp. NPDC092286]|uniref:ATP-binding protein n=1 Tax=Kitasatospora sp. NPDC092286 TaxID=3364087 RepID=UPI00382A5E5D
MRLTHIRMRAPHARWSHERDRAFTECHQGFVVGLGEGGRGGSAAVPEGGRAARLRRRVFVVISPLNTARFPVLSEWGVAPDAAAVSSARRLVVEVARVWGVPFSDEALREVELCADEVIANAVEHTGERCTVTLRWSDGRLRVEVADLCSELRDRQDETDPTGGRGLLLVAGLAHGWGWHPSGAGKVVWFEYAADALLPTHGWGAGHDLRPQGQMA